MSLKPGSVLDPTSVGKAGMWRVDGPGVLDVHGFIYFDGKALYVQSADDRTPITVNKHRVATAWTEVRAPSTIALGEVELAYRDEPPAVYDDADETVARPMPAVPTRPEFVPGGGAFVNRADDESTRFAPIEGLPVGGGGMMDPARPASGTPVAPFPPQPLPSPMDFPPGMMGMGGMGGGMGGMGMHPDTGAPLGMPPLGIPGMQGGMPGMAGAPGVNGAGQTNPGQGKKGWEKFKAEWEALPPVRRALYIMAPFTFAAACIILFDDGPPPQPVKPSPSASASGSAPRIAPSAPPSAGPVAPAPDAGSPALVATADAATSPTSDAPEKDAGTSSTPPTAPGKRTTERLAADAWAEGSFAKAAQLYDQLATENPQNPAYREAARILREKIDAGAR